MRNYIKKGTNYHNYQNDLKMKLAVEDVRLNSISVKKASELYGINRTTLMYHVKNLHTGHVGKPTALSHDEEELLVHGITKLAEWGFGIDRSDVLSIVADFIKLKNLEGKFKNGYPGNDWMLGFEKRWSHVISRRVGQNLPLNRAFQCNERVLSDFYNKLASIQQRLGLENSPANIFNVDETGFQTDAGKQKILCRKGIKNPHKTVGTTTKVMYTVQECCSADGKYLSPYIVYKGKNLYQSWCTGGPHNVKYTVSKSGWMEADQFKEWFRNVFIEETKEIRGPKILVLDGHSSHISLAVIDLAIENQIELLCLPAHTSHLLQPLDKCVYKSVKAAWRKIVREHYAQTRHSNIDKVVFPSLLRKLHESECFSRQNAISGFEATGIYPFNPSRIAKENISPSAPMEEQPSSSSLPQPADEIILSTPGPSTTPLTPRSSLEKAILNHLQYNKPQTTDKRKRVKRCLAECLTESEVRERIEENEKKRKMKNDKSLKKGNCIGKGRPLDTCAVENNDGDSDSDNLHADIMMDDEDDDEDVDQTCSVRCGHWLLVKFSVGKTNKAVYYVGQVVSMSDHEKTVSFLRKINGSCCFIWPEHEDNIVIDDVQINRILSEPTTDRRQRLMFTDDLENLNVM